jgi:hypothetical protein
MSGHGTGARGAAQVAALPDATNPNLLPLRVAGPARGYGNLFGPLAAGNRYSVNGLIKPDGTIDAADRKTLHNRMGQLAHRILKEPEIDYGAAPVGAGAPMPAGYTYLLQFIAHDMVDTTQSMNVSSGRLDFAYANTRARSLCLDTIYGPGPDEAPHAYEPTDDDGTRPRTRLRIEPAPADAPIRGRCLRGDIGRAVNPGDKRGSALDVLKAAIGEALKPKYDGPNHQSEETVARIVSETACNWTTQPLIADPRNDAHAIMSQMTVLFHRLHNEVMEIVDPRDGPRQGRTLEKVYRRFLCARTAVTLIYREIVLKDVLERVLYRPVYEHYIRDRKPLCDGGDAIPIEFSHGAFRFGHAMVREDYRINHRAREPIGLREAMVQTSATKSGVSPVSGSWIVDWSRFFFDAGAAAAPGEVRNFSMGICPREGKAFEKAFESKNEGEDWKGLSVRDLLAACYAGLWSVPELLARLARDHSKLPPLEPQHLDFEGFWKPAILDWLGQYNSAGESWPEDWSYIAADPPLPFFVMYEAKQVCNGLRLGPVGSIILAETFRAAIERTPLAEPSDLGLAQRLKNCAAALLPDKPGVLDGLADSRIDSMPRLLDFLAGEDAFVGA